MGGFEGIESDLRAAEKPRMAKKVQKKQKNFLLPKDVSDWIDRMENTTGVTQGRLALAAFCAFKLCTEYTQREAMMFAMAVERGQADFAELRKAWIGHHIALSERALEFEDFPPGCHKIHRECIKKLKAELEKHTDDGFYCPKTLVKKQ